MGGASALGGAPGASGADHVAGSGSGEQGSAGSGARHEPSEDALIVPERLSVAPHSGSNGGLVVKALTLRAGSAERELYAVVKNEGDKLVCSPSFSVELYDGDEVPLATGLAGLLVWRFFRPNEQPELLAACLGPGDETAVAIRDLPADLVIEDVARVAYYSNFWNLTGVEVGSLSIEDVEVVSNDVGAAYKGTLENGLDVPIPAPSVAIFPVTAAGRPLGVTYAKGNDEVAAQGRWEFETEVLDVASTPLAAGYVALPASGP